MSCFHRGSLYGKYNLAILTCQVFANTDLRSVDRGQTKDEKGRGGDPRIYYIDLSKVLFL